MIHPELQQEFFKNENLPNYRKAAFEKDIFELASGTGLIFSEHENWKMKRKVLNSAFNFDFLTSLAPKIARICDEVLDKVEG